MRIRALRRRLERDADAVAQWAAVRDAALAREVDALLADLFPEES